MCDTHQHKIILYAHQNDFFLERQRNLCTYAQKKLANTRKRHIFTPKDMRTHKKDSCTHKRETSLRIRDLYCRHPTHTHNWPIFSHRDDLSQRQVHLHGVTRKRPTEKPKQTYKHTKETYTHPQRWPTLEIRAALSETSATSCSYKYVLCLYAWNRFIRIDIDIYTYVYTWGDMHRRHAQLLLRQVQLHGITHKRPANTQNRHIYTQKRPTQIHKGDSGHRGDILETRAQLRQRPVLCHYVV